MTGGRIVSLLASATEIVAALGLTDRLVAISHQCDYPTEILELPVCTAPKINTTGSSYDINLSVKELVERGLSVFRVDSNKLRALSPDLIITQSQCEVCAVSERDLKDAVANWTNGRPEIVSLRPDCLLDVWRDISNVALAAGVEKTGANLITALKKKMQLVVDRATGLRNRPLVACIEWIEPLMFAGNWVPEIVNIAGGIDLFGKAGHHSEWSEYEELYSKDPDKIIFMPCGYTIERTESELKELIQHNKWNNLKAVKEGQIYLTDGNQYFNRPGPRLLDSIKIMDDIIKDENTHSLRGTGWKKIGT